MRKPSCKTCIFGEDCSSPKGVCPHYTPIDEDDFIDKYIEQRRKEFSEEWSDYIAEDRLTLLY